MGDDLDFVSARAIHDLGSIAPPADDGGPSDGTAALALAILGVVCLGFLFGPIAVALARRAELARLDAHGTLDGGRTRAAMSLGRAGMALHLTALATALPWVLFMLPFLFEK